MRICNLKREDVETSGKIIPIEGKIFWHIDENYITSDMDKYKVILAFEKVFQILQPYFNPIFTSTGNSADSQITIKFMNEGDAGLPEPFGEGTLAYAFLANNTTAKGLISDIFINDFYEWAEMHSPTKINLVKVIVHEALHSTGLFHSEDAQDILYWLYQDNDEINFTQDTIDSIEFLYGVKSSSTVPKLIEDLFLEKKHIKKLYKFQLQRIATELGISTDKKTKSVLCNDLITRLKIT